MADPNFYVSGTRVTIDGVDVTDLVDVTVSEQGVQFDEFDVLDDQYKRYAELDSFMASGTVRIKSKYNTYSNDPMGSMEFLSLIAGYSQYDTTNDIVEMVFDSAEQTTTDLKGPKRIVELRQTEALASHYISDSGSADEAFAQSFVAAGEDIYLVRLKLYDKAATKVESFDLEIWDDSGGSPNAKLTNTNTVTVNCDTGSDDATNDYIGALTSGTGYGDATWETIDMSANTPNIMGTASLTIGTTYWLVIRNVQDANDDLGVTYSTSDRYDGGEAKQDDDVGNSPAWGDHTAAKDLTFVIQCQAAEGHTMRIYDYDTSTTGYYTQYNGVRFSRGQASPSAKATQENTLNWTAQTVSGPSAFS